MDRLRPRERGVFNGFTDAEVEKLEKLFEEMGEDSLNRDICLRTARCFSRASGRAGKPVVKWNEVQDWFRDKQEKCQPTRDSPTGLQEETAPPDASKQCHTATCTQKRASEDSDANGQKKASQHPKCNMQKEDQKPNLEPKATEKGPDLSELEFEARSSRDGAWYDVDRFLTHRILSSGEAEVLVRFVGFGAEEDEWVNVRRSVRERSIPLEHWECQTVKPGDVLLCLQERKDQAIYYDAHVLDVQRKMHDIRGCRCIFLVCYDHDKTEERVRLRRLCRQP